MKKWKYKKLQRISNERKIVDQSISDELKNEDITELLNFMRYFKLGAGNEDSYTIFRALPRRNFCNDKPLSDEVNNISYEKNVHNMYAIDTFYFTINSFIKKYGNKTKYKEATSSLENLSAINIIAFDVDFKDCTALAERFDDDKEAMMDYITNTVNSILPVNAVVFSGNGCHLYFNINNEVISQKTNEKKEKVRKYKNLCTTIANEFYYHDIICDFHVTGEVCRILRVPYSYNTKTTIPKQSYIYYKNYCEPYDIEKLFERFNVKSDVIVQDLTRKSNNNNSNNKEIKNNGHLPVINNGYTTPNTDESLYTRNTQTKSYAQTVANRLEDIKKFTALKKDYEGRRNTLLSMTAIMLNDVNENGDNAFMYNVEREIDIINSHFSVPLEEKEMKTIKENYSKYVFKYKTTNTWWSEVLGLTKIDMTYSKEIINKAEAKRRKKITVRRKNKKQYEKNKEKINSEKRQITLNNKQEKIKNENELVAELIKQGKTNKEIAEKLGCSLSKAKRIRRRIN